MMNKKELKEIKIYITGFELLEFCLTYGIDFPLWLVEGESAKKLAEWVNSLPKPLRFKFIDYFKVGNEK